MTVGVLEKYFFRPTGGKVGIPVVPGGNVEIS